MEKGHYVMPQSVLWFALSLNTWWEQCEPKQENRLKGTAEILLLEITMSFSQVFDEILSVLVSCPCSNQSPQTSWLKITHPYYPIVLEITSRKWISPSQRQNLVSRAVFLLEVLGGNPLSCLFQLLEACRHSFTPGYVFSLQSLQWHHRSWLLWSGLLLRLSLPLSFPSKDPCSYVGPTQATEDNLPISGSWTLSHLRKSLLPHKVTSAQIP